MRLVIYFLILLQLLIISDAKGQFIFRHVQLSKKEVSVKFYDYQFKKISITLKKFPNFPENDSCLFSDSTYLNNSYYIEIYLRKIPYLYFIPAHQRILGVNVSSIGTIEEDSIKSYIEITTLNYGSNIKELLKISVKDLKKLRRSNRKIFRDSKRNALTTYIKKTKSKSQKTIL